MQLRFSRTWRLARTLVDLDARAQEEAWDYYTRLLPPLRRRLTRALGDTLSRRVIVDFGCGYAYPLVCLLAPEVGTIVGVDVNVTHHDWAIPVPTARRVPRAWLWKFVEHALTCRVHRDIVAIVGPPRNGQPYLTLPTNGRAIPLPDGYAEAIISNSVLQELPLPLECFAEDMARVLRPGGYIDLEWHNFYSLSGNYGDQSLRRADPWGHLLGRPVDPLLNRVKPGQVIEAFDSWFCDLRVLAHDANYRVEGEDEAYEAEEADLLTPELATRLAGLPRALLVTRGFVLVGRKRDARRRTGPAPSSLCNGPRGT
jgi:SAM-dependent methyltransferase